ncbi:response regulator, partial [Microvirga tunisiensis]
SMPRRFRRLMTVRRQPSNACRSRVMVMDVGRSSEWVVCGCFLQQSHGHVEVDSAPGAGTTIRMFLPRVEAAIEQLPEPRDTVPSSFGAGQTVLVVEDDPAVRQVAVSTLKSLGFNVMEAASGDEAARLLKANRQVDLVFSDIRMPGKLTGIGLARLIRREMPKIRVLLTTGHVDGDETIEDIDLLYKPYRAVDLAEKIQVLMAAVQSADGEAFDVDAAASAAE